jgi:hypothetical protein
MLFPILFTYLYLVVFWIWCGMRLQDKDWLIFLLLCIMVFKPLAVGTLPLHLFFYQNLLLFQFFLHLRLLFWFLLLLHQYGGRVDGLWDRSGINPLPLSLSQLGLLVGFQNSSPLLNFLDLLGLQEIETGRVAFLKLIKGRSMSLDNLISILKMAL